MIRRLNKIYKNFGREVAAVLVVDSNKMAI
jgi:hypothetical protein